MEGGASDPQEEGVKYHCTEAIRTKPGRGDRTLSLSCSDKILKWNVVGIQGSCLSLLLFAPLHLTSIILGCQTFDVEATQRAVHHRYKGKCVLPDILNCTQVEFPFVKTDDRVPCPDSMLYVEGENGFHEAYVAGLKQGWPRKKLVNPKSWSPVNQRNLGQLTVKVLAKLNLPSDFSTYQHLKLNHQQYNEAKRQFKHNLSSWPKKDEKLYNFSLK